MEAFLYRGPTPVPRHPPHGAPDAKEALMDIVGGIVVLVLVVVFSTLLGLLLAASIGIRRSDSGRYGALRHGGGTGSFSNAGRTLSGLRFPERPGTGDSGSSGARLRAVPGDGSESRDRLTAAR